MLCTAHLTLSLVLAAKAWYKKNPVNICCRNCNICGIKKKGNRIVLRFKP